MNAGTSVQLLSEDNAEAVASARPSWADVVPSCLERSRHGTSVTFVAFRGGRPVGLADLACGDVPEIKNVGVLPDLRGQGVGSVLMAEMERWAARGHTAVTLRVGLENDDARRLYLRLGYLPTGETSTVSYEYLDDDGQLRTATETDAWMTKGLA
ncbi:GNAT family N-acetyltransferase [Citricoccus nitrophenolicus]|uniref:GNAT family N-acetyltransferase n=1 Tax=Citricoccus nitrophenolicus TaxID=863575 RepID=A0ABV0ILP3_9MICC